MGHKGRAAILFIELPHRRAYVSVGAYPGDPDPQAFVATHYGIATACAIVADTGGE